MSEICQKCGLPKDICVCGTIQKQNMKIMVFTTKKRYGKLVTIVAGVPEKDIHSVAKHLKRKLACGGNAKNGEIILQGGKLDQTRMELVKMGYPEDAITIQERA